MPDPIPALPDTERRTSYSVTTSTVGPFDVGFAIYGNGTDYANWVEVWVDGVQILTGWTLDSPSGTLAELPRPITDARITFDDALAGSVSIPVDLQIRGARRPRRTSQYGNAPVPRDFNKDLTDIVSMQREMWDKFASVLRIEPGDIGGLIPFDRANKVVGFDLDKRVALYTPSGGSAIIPIAVETLVALQAFAPSELGVVLAGRGTAGDGGGGLFFWDASDRSTDVTADTRFALTVPPSSDLTGASGAWRRVVVDPTIMMASWFGSNPSATAAVNTAAVAAAISLAHSKGGGVIQFSAGTHLFDTPVDASFYTIQITDQDNVTLRGAGRDITVLKCNDPDNSGGISLTRANNIKIEDLTVDGNAGGVYLAFHGIRLEDVDGVVIQRVAIRHARSYGIGGEAGTLKHLRFEDIIVDDVGRDCIDFKNKNDDNEDHVFNRLTLGNFGGGGAVDDCALDVRCPHARISNVLILGDILAINHAGVRLRGDSIAVNGIGARHAVVTNVVAENTGASPMQGNAVAVDNVSCAVTGISGKNLASVVAFAPNSIQSVAGTIAAESCAAAVQFSGSDNRATNVNANGCTNGALFGGTDNWLDGAKIKNSTGNDLDQLSPAPVRPKLTNIEASTIAFGGSGPWVYGIGTDFADLIKFRDEFIGQALSNHWGTKTGTNGTAAVAVSAALDGAAKLTTGNDAGGTMALNGAQLSGSTNWRASAGHLSMKFKVNVSAISNLALYVGFTDQTAALEMPFALAAGDALTSNTSNGCGILFDTAADTDNWWLVGVTSDVDATKQNTGIAPVANTDEVWQIEVSTTGVATFTRNGVVVGTAMAGAVNTGASLTPVVAAFSRDATIKNVRVNYIELTMVRA